MEEDTPPISQNLHFYALQFILISIPYRINVTENVDAIGEIAGSYQETNTLLKDHRGIENVITQYLYNFPQKFFHKCINVGRQKSIFLLK